MEILITESQFERIIKEEYSENIIQQLRKKFITDENPYEDWNKVKDYINIFDKIKNGPNIANKDIFTYTLPELENVVLDYMRNRKPKSFKGNSDLDLKYSKDGLEIFLADGKEKCIKYGEGYHFCISSRGEDNLYGDYRISRRGTPYFIFNRNLEGAKDPDDADKKTFIEPNHLIVLFVYESGLPDEGFIDGDDDEYVEGEIYYSVTDANNDSEPYYLHFENIVKRYPWLKNLEKLFVPVDLTMKEYGMLDLEKFIRAQLTYINRKYPIKDVNSNTECSNISGIKFRTYGDLLGKDDKMYINFLDSYNKKIFKTYTIFYPRFVSPTEIEYKRELREKYTGPNGLSEAKQMIINAAEINKNNLAELMTRNPNDKFKMTNFKNSDYIEYYKKASDVKNFKIKECNWDKEFIIYMGQINKLYKEMVYEMWMINQDND